MPDSSFRDDETDGSFIFPIVYFFVGTFAALDLWSAYEPSAWNWGFHFLAFYPLEVRVAIPALMLGILVPQVQFFIIDFLRWIVTKMTGQPLIFRRVLGFIALAVMAFFFFQFRVATYFLGDGYLQLRSLKLPENAETLNLTGFAREPLVGFLIFQLSRLFSFLESSTPPEDAYLWLSLLSGIAFASIVWKGIGLFIDDETDRPLVFFFLLSTGVNLLFFGYVENYAPGYVGILLFLLLAIAYLKERISIYWPMGAYGLLLSMNFGAAALVPALVYLVIIGIRRKETTESLAAVALSGFVFAAALVLSGYSPSFFQRTFEDASVNILPVAGPTGKHQAYSIFNLDHLVDVTNLFLLCTPAAVALLTVSIVSIIKKRKPLEMHQKFILLAMACGVGLIAVLNCTLGMSRDWDIPAPFSIGIPVAAVALWMTIAEDREVRQRVLLILGVITMLQTGAWVALNSDERRAVSRLEILGEKRLWGSEATLDAFEELAIYHRDRREFAQAASCYERYLAVDSTNARIWLNCAKAEQAAGNYDRAIDSYKVLERSGPPNPENLAALGVLLARMEHTGEALRYLKQAETLSPKSSKIKNDIGALLANEKDYSSALPYFLEAIRLDPNFRGGYLNAAACYSALGDNGKAQEYGRMGRGKQ